MPSDVSENRLSPSNATPDRPGIGFAIPFYQGKDYLRQAIYSVLQQTVPDWELVIIDDSVNEKGIRQLVEGYQDARIRYVKNPSNLGMGATWNRCLDLVQTPWVTILHADDQLLPKYIEIFQRGIQTYPNAVAIHCRAMIIDSAGNLRFSFVDWVKGFFRPQNRRVIETMGEVGLSSLMKGNFIVCPSLCFNKALLKERRFRTDWKFVLDWEMTSRLVLDGETLIGLPDKGYAYRRHSSNATNEYTQSMVRFEEERDLLQLRYEDAKQHQWPHAAKIARKMGIVRWYLCYIIFYNLLHGSWSIARKQLNFLMRLRSP